MAINFPSTAGQAVDGTFTYVVAGITYSWNGESWTAAGGGATTANANAPRWHLTRFNRFTHFRLDHTTVGFDTWDVQDAVHISTLQLLSHALVLHIYGHRQ